MSSLLDKKGWANARDHYGHSPLHKSVMANQVIVQFVYLISILLEEAMTLLGCNVTLSCQATESDNQSYVCK